jgi:Tfp pilus assembly protein PilF
VSARRTFTRGSYVALALAIAPVLGVACGGNKPAESPKTASSASSEPTATVAETPAATSTPPEAAPPPPPPAGSGGEGLAGSAKDAYAKGIASYNAGDLAGASASFQSAVSAEPKAYEAHYALGNVLEHQGRYSEALEHYREAYKLNDNYGAAFAAYGYLLYRQGSKTEAETFLADQSAKHPKDLLIMTAAAEIKSLQGDSATAQTLAQNALTIDGKYEAAMVLIARDHFRRGRVDLANYVLGAILDGQRTEDERAKGLPAKTNPPRAPTNADAHLLRAEILERANERREAAKWFDSASKLRGDLVDARLQLGLIRLEANDVEGALEPLEKAVAYAPGNVDAHLALAETYRLVGGRASDAKREYNWVVNASASPAQLKATAQYNLGLLYFLTPNIDAMNDVSRFDKSIEYFNAYKTAKGTASGPSWPSDVDDLLEQARRSKEQAKAASAGGTSTAKKPTPAPTTPPASSAPPKPATSAPPPTAPPPAASASTAPAKPASSAGVKDTF